VQIYKITNILNNKIYIGKDTTSDTNYFGSGLMITRSITKYGIENFTKEVIDETDDYEELSKKEIYWIDKYNSTDRNVGYNISKGGDGGDVFKNHPDIELIKEKISKNNPKTGKTYEEAFGEEKSLKYKQKLRKNLHKNILSLEVKEKQNKKWKEFNNNFKNRCQLIKEEIDKGNLNDYLDELKLIKNRVSNNFLRNASGFYNFFGDNLRYVFGRLKIREDETFIKLENFVKNKDVYGLIEYLDELPNRFFKKRNDFYEYIGTELKLEIKIKLYESRKKVEYESKVAILIDNIKYNSISEASKQLNIDRAKIRYRLKSSHFKNYLFQDNGLNIKYNKFIEIDPYLSKKEPISIKDKEYESITQASKDLNKSDDYITWRLNSKSYPDWIYLKKVVELKETGEPKKKRVSILGNEYDSIAEAVKKSGIDRQIMRYRLKSKNHPDYFYI
jgi:hypothetical protein